MTSTSTARHFSKASALALSTAVIALSVGGSAVAGSLVTSKDIKNGTITSVDVKDKGLTRADVRPQSRTSVIWTSDDSSGIDLEQCGDTTLEDCDALLTVKVQPGTQLLTASATLDNTSAVVPAISNRCGLVQGDDVLTETRFALAANTAPGELMSFTLQQVVTVPDASLPVSLKCTEMPTEALRLNDPRLTSVRTGF